MSSYVVATYQVEEKPEKLSKRAESIAIGLTVGSWTDLPLATQEHVKKHRGEVIAIEQVTEMTGGLVQARISVGYPVINFTNQIPALLTTVFGKLSMDGKIRLVGLDIPLEYTKQFPGPKYGLPGLRNLTGVHHRPWLMSIFKSCIGHDLQTLTKYFREQALGGVDFVKDDEIFFTESYATPEERVQAYARTAREVEGQTGIYVRYAVNLAGPTSQLLERAKRLSDLGAGALLVNAFAFGYDVVQELASHPDVRVPIMVHPAISGALYGSPDYGIAANIALGSLMRLAGADLVIYPSAYGSVTLHADEGQRLVEALRVENGLTQSVPVPSAGIHPGLVPQLVKDLGIDFVVNAGGGIHGHPNGATAGGQAFSAAIQAAVTGVSLRKAAQDSPALEAALNLWGER